MFMESSSTMDIERRRSCRRNFVFPLELLPISLCCCVCCFLYVAVDGFVIQSSLLLPSMLPSSVLSSSSSSSSSSSIYPPDMVNMNNTNTNKNDNDNTDNTAIQVYDNVLSQKSCQLLHEAAAQGGLGHKVFERRRQQQRNYETTTSSRKNETNKDTNTNTNTATTSSSRKHNTLKQPSVVPENLEDAHQLLCVYQKQAQDVKNEKRCIIEEALEAILTELEDHDDENNNNNNNNTNMKRRQYVEYWTRQEWRHIEAHADVDEHRAKDYDRRTTIKEEDDDDDQPPQQDAATATATATASYRYPIQGHVLYLQVGTNVRGPTCVFPNIQTGGELLASVSKDDEDNNDDDNDNAVSKQHPTTSVPALVIPAVEGRVLQFPGNLLHTVPRPTDLWYVSFVMGGTAYQPTELWGRSVILFNTWYDTPPHQVPLTITPTAIHPNSDVVNKRKEWQPVFPYSSSGLVPSVSSSFEETGNIETAEQQKQQEWNNYPEDTSARESDEQQQQQQHEEEEKDAMSNVKIWLLGNERRRDHALRTVNLQAKTSSKAAFLESHRVSMIELEQR